MLTLVLSMKLPLSFARDLLPMPFCPSIYFLWVHFCIQLCKTKFFGHPWNLRFLSLLSFDLHKISHFSETSLIYLFIANIYWGPIPCTALVIKQRYTQDSRILETVIYQHCLILCVPCQTVSFRRPGSLSPLRRHPLPQYFSPTCFGS